MHDNKLLLERYSAGEIDADEARRIEAHCTTCTECSDYVKKLKTDRQQFLAVHPFSRFKPAVTPAPGRPWYAELLDPFRHPALVPACSLIIILLVLSPIIYFARIHHPVTSEITFKGSDALSFLLNRNGLISVCTHRDTLYPGDEIQVLYSIAKKGYLTLLSIDSYGTISWYHPDLKSTFCTIPVKPGRNQNYPTAILLDEAKGRELIVALFSATPLSIETVNNWVSRAIKKTNMNISMLRQELDSTGDKINAMPLMAIFQKGQD